MNIRSTLSIVVMTFCALVASIPAQATTISPLTPTQILQQFNLVVLQNVVSNSSVDGRTYIGGTSFGGEYAQQSSDVPTSNYAGVTVRGSVNNIQTGSSGAYVGGNMTNSYSPSGTSYVAGNVSNSELNGSVYVAGTKTNTEVKGSVLTSPTASMQINAGAASSTNFYDTLTQFSAQLKTMPSTTSSVSFSEHNQATFNAVANSAGVAVFNLSGTDNQVFSQKELKFNTNGASTIIINSNLTAASIFANFADCDPRLMGTNIIWNFYNATNLTINSQFGGSILATGATLINNQEIDGGVYVQNLVQNAEIHYQPVTGMISSVPELDTYSSMLAGLALIGVTFSFRKKS